MNFWLLLLHTLGACLWVGGHGYLALVVLPKALRAHTSQPLLDFEASFDKIGMAALLVQVLTGLTMAHQYLPQWSMLTDGGNPIALLVRAKLVWLALTLLTAASAQLWIVPRVRREPLDARLRALFCAHIVLVTLFSVGFVVTGVLFRTGLNIF